MRPGLHQTKGQPSDLKLTTDLLLLLSLLLIPAAVVGLTLHHLRQFPIRRSRTQRLRATLTLLWMSLRLPRPNPPSPVRAWTFRR